MLERAFTEKNPLPDDVSLAKVCGKAFRWWQELLESLANAHGAIQPEWKFYPKAGWTLKVLLKKRNLFFMMPFQDAFRVAFVFGDKAVAAIEKSDLPKPLLETLKNAKKYAEGRGLPVDVQDKRAMETVKKLVRYKLEN
jgi:hypothetical protein